MFLRRSKIWCSVLGLCLCAVFVMAELPVSAAGTGATGLAVLEQQNGDTDDFEAEGNGTGTQPDSIPTLEESLKLYQGEKRYLDIANAGGKSKVSLQSSDKDVVKVSSTGKMTAVSSGRATITVTMKKGDMKSCVKILVDVSVSKYDQSPNYGKKITIKKSNKRFPVFTFHRQMEPSDTKAISISNIMGSEEVAFLSSKPAVAQVSKNGIISAKKTGTATISIRIKQYGKIYLFQEKVHVAKKKTTERITTEQRNTYFSTAGFVGSSIGVGQKSYFKSQGEGYLGNPVMMVKGCYSFMNDKSSSNTYKVTYQGTPYMAKDAIARSGVDKVFINMGTNDLWVGPQKAYEQYVSYLKGIRARNPKVVIFIESTTPVCKEKAGHLTNANVDQLNSLMKTYCKKQKDMYYIDVNSVLKGTDGKLKAEYASDGHVHLTGKAYSLWMKEVCDFTDRLMMQEQKAEDAVKTVEQSRSLVQYQSAQKILQKLENSTVKSDLKERLKKIKKKGLI